MRIDPEDTANEVAADGRRARLADIQRVEAALAEATARLKAIEEFIAVRENAPIPRSHFYAQVYAMAILAGKRPGFIRDFADASWESYSQAISGAPRKTIDELYSFNQPEPESKPSNEIIGC